MSIFFGGAGIRDINRVASYEALRASTSQALQIDITGAGIFGSFRYVADDVTTADNGGTWIVRADGRRFKREFSGPANPAWFGASADATAAANVVALAATIAACDNVSIEDDLPVNAPVALKSGLRLQCGPAGKLRQVAGVLGYMLTGNGVSNVRLSEMTVEGNGEVESEEVAGFSNIRLYGGCSDVVVERSNVTKAGSIGIEVNGSTNVRILNNRLNNNYFYGVGLTDCDGCEVVGNLCAENGFTGVATSEGGRGIFLWRTRGSKVALNRLVGNSEYGFRIYSEEEDASFSFGNLISGNVLKDNVRCDFVLYDESLTGDRVFRNTIADNIVERSTNSELGCAYLLHGSRNTLTGNSAYKTGDFGTDVAFNFYYAFDCTVTGGSTERMAVAFSFSGSERITVTGHRATEVAQFATVLLEDITLRDCVATHGGAGVADVAIPNYASATGKNTLEGLHLSGFHTGIYIGDEPVALFRNKTTGSGFAGLRKTGNETAQIEAGGNSWDSAEPYLLSAFTRTSSTHDRATVRYPSVPDALAWSVGDRWIKESPGAGAVSDSTCTGAGVGVAATWKATATAAA